MYRPEQGWKKGLRRTLIILVLHLTAVLVHSLLLAFGEARTACAETPVLYASFTVRRAGWRESCMRCKT